MFLLPHRNTRNGMLKASQYLDNNYNIDLANAVNAIYLGERFGALNNSGELLEKVICICKRKSIRLFKRIVRDGKKESISIL